MKKSIMAFILCAVLVFSGCAQSRTTTSETALDELTIVLDWYPNGSHVFLYEALERGYYLQEGIELDIEFPSNTNDAISMTAAGKADIGFYYMHDVIQANANQGIPVVSIGAVVQKPVNVMISLKEKGINSVSDLMGKKIGYGGSVLNEAFISTMLKTAGLSLSDVELIDVGFELMSSMTTGQVDATIGGFISHEVPQLEQQGFDVTYIKPTENGVPDYSELVFVTSKATADSKAELLTRFLRATQKGYRSTVENPTQAIENLIKNQNTENFPLNIDVETQSVNTILQLAQTEETSFLSQDKAMWQNNIDWMLDEGIISERVNPDDLIVELIS